jgi:hypothetical protein
MTFRVKFTPTAALQFERLDTWWKENRDKNPFLFADEVDGAIEFLEIDPEGGFAIESRVGAYFRRVPLERTRNQIYYWHEPGNEVVWIVCFWGGPKKRQPQLSLDEIP